MKRIVLLLITMMTMVTANAQRLRVGDGTSGMSSEDFDELLLERSPKGGYWLHFAVRPSDNRRKVRLIQSLR